MSADARLVQIERAHRQVEPTLPVPAGWFCVGWSDVLPKGGILVRRVGGHELVLFRTQAGHAAAPCSCPWPPTRLLAALAFREFRRDVEQDLIIWNNKRHITPPALALGDGPVGAYRKWARQFYEEAP